MQKRRILTIALAIGILIIWRQIHTNRSEELIRLKGVTMGVVPYAISYLDVKERDFQNAVDSILTGFNQSLSTYISDSEISIFNNTDTLIQPSEMFLDVVEMSKEVYQGSNGAFDPTVGPLVNAWGFGKDKNARIDSSTIDSLKAFVGFNQVILADNQIIKPNGTVLDFSASAKGYAVDLVARYLKEQGIDNYMVEIGGEVICKGTNQDGNIWKIGIQEPTMSATYGKSFAIAQLKNRAMATSGNYRNYYEENGRIISHTIDPKSGYSVRHNLLSATIFALDCGSADAYATACMVLGVEKSIEMVERLDDVDALLIFSDEAGNFKTYVSERISKSIEIL